MDDNINYDDFFKNKITKEAITFDDILLVPQYSEILPNEAGIHTMLTKKIKLNIPVISSAMDTVTEHQLAISMAREGGLGVIHRNLSIEDQVKQVIKVKRSEFAIIKEPLTLKSNNTIKDAFSIMTENKISGVPIVDSDNKLKGIITNRDLRSPHSLKEKIEDYMTKDNLVTSPVGTTLEEAKILMNKNKIEKLLIVDENFHLHGLITMKDINKIMQFPNSCKDELGRLRVGAAVGVKESEYERAEELIKASCDVVIVDTAHGHSSRVINQVKKIKQKYPDSNIIAGNIATKEGYESLVKAGADAVKIGIGPGSICTTRIVAGVGVPQITAIIDCADAAREIGIPIIADGGIRYSGDIAKAIAAGANVVMLGNLLAGTHESPGEMIQYQGKAYKTYRGMGSIAALREGSKDRYSQDTISDPEKIIPEGIEGRISYKGYLSNVLLQLTGGLKASMGYCGSQNIEDFQKKSVFVKISSAGYKESHPHGVQITKEAPNYSVSESY